MKVSDSILAPINSFVNRSAQTERIEHYGKLSSLASGLHLIKMMKLLCRLLTSAQSPHALLHEALPPVVVAKLGRSPRV
ncbi:MAG: hypothetical protein KDG55_24040, partial [Rhodocyclaceae bacterium]|nr:hypothetical protein [Rhodocyclaceae bacterium]